MTDPMTSVEIEDVLSSIRRLVSEDLRPGMTAAGRPAPQAVAGQAVAAPAFAPEADKLLLTPALRVVPSEDPLPEALLDPLSEVIPEAPFVDVPASDDSGRGAVVARIGAQVRDDWDAEVETAPAGWPAPTWDAEVVEVDLEAVEEAEVLEVTSVEEARLEDAWRDGAWPEERSVETENVETENDPVTLFQSSLEEEGEASEMVPSALADLAEAAVLAEIEAADSAAAMAATADLFAPQDSEDFDEEALREVVRDIIREELQGALGERITRNVRKLVRAEINRALASRELS